MKPMKKIPSLVVSTVRLATVYFRDFIEEAKNLSTSMGVGANNIQVGDVIDLPDKADKVGRITDIKKMDGYSLVICSFEERPIIKIGPCKYPLKLDKRIKDWKFETNDHR